MNPRAFEVEYRITMETGELVSISTAHRGLHEGPLPQWTELACERCPGCPLADDEDARCPAAVAVAPLIERVAHHRSTERVHVEVRTEERTVLKDTDMQAAVQSACGLLMSRSDCPVLSRLRRLGDFHLPFASLDETLFRVASSLALDALERGQNRSDWLVSLRELYATLEAVNRAFARRLRARCPGDAGVNAIIKLFSLSVLISEHVEVEPVGAFGIDAAYHEA